MNLDRKTIDSYFGIYNLIFHTRNSLLSMQQS